MAATETHMVCTMFASHKHFGKLNMGQEVVMSSLLIKRSTNYGWPITSQGKEYSRPISAADATEKEEIESPIKVYIP